MNGILILALLFALFWFFAIRPQRARAREQQELIASLEPGDEIVTAGGLYGVITEVDGEVLHVEIAEGLVVRTARNAVAGIVEEEEDEEAPDVEEAETPGEDDEPVEQAGPERTG
jgi:preprotein translocase subunit YajC